MTTIQQSIVAWVAVCGLATVGLASGGAESSAIRAVPVSAIGPVAIGVSAPLTITGPGGRVFELLADEVSRTDAPRDALAAVLGDDAPRAIMTMASGRVMGGGSFVIASTGAGVSGAMWTPEGNFEFRGLGTTDANGDPIAEIIEVPGDLPECAGGLNERTGAEDDHALVRGAAAAGSTQLRGTDTVTRAFLVFSTQVANRLGSDAQVASFAASAISSANAAYANSNINPLRLELAGYVVLDEPAGGFSSTLRYLTGRGEGFLDEALLLRDAYNADIVPMITEMSGACGVAWLSPENPQFSSFSLTDPDCAIGNLTFAHEVGHNYGAAHDPDNSGSAFTSYAFGHRWSTGQGTFRSVMAYSPGQRQPNFSNPDIALFGGATGIANERDNARLHNLTQGILSNYRSGGLDTTDCNASGTPDALEIATGLVRDDNRNGRPDACDIADDATLDCDGDGVLDAFQIRPRVTLNTLPFGSIGEGNTVSASIQGLAPADGPVTMTLVAHGDFSGSGEFFTLELGSSGAWTQDFLTSGGSDCFAPHHVIDVQLDEATFNSLLSGTSMPIGLSATDSVNPELCSMPTQVSFRFDYRTVNAALDANGDGLIDGCSPVCAADYNGDGAVNVLDVTTFIGVWTAGAEGADYNNDGAVNVLDVIAFIGVWNAGCA